MLFNKSSDTCSVANSTLYSSFATSVENNIMIFSCSVSISMAFSLRDLPSLNLKSAKISSTLSKSLPDTERKITSLSFKK